MLTESGFFKDDETQKDELAHDERFSRSSVPPDLAPGRRIASEKYELLRKIGVGAMGEVWAAKHRSLDEEVAIKMVLRGVDHADGSTADGRFLVEARVARMLSRKTRHIVSVTDHGSDDDMAYLVMELLHGEPLDTRLGRSGPLPLDRVIPVIRQVARALAVAHADGIVHRDLKPGNVFVTLDEEGHPLIKILDFGIAKLADAEAERDSAPPAPIGVSAQEAKQKTLRGFLLGTPAYMSPEQARGKRVDHRADVWALAVITYHLLTNEFPFDGKDAEELFQRLVRVKAYPITDHRKDLPPAMADLFLKAFARRIEDRFQTAEDFASALEDASENRSPSVMPVPSRSPGSTPTPKPTLKSAAAKEESSIIAAGVPRKNRRGAAVLVVGLFALLGLFAIGFGRVTSARAPSGIAAGALEVGQPTTLTRSDELIPAPEPAAPVPVTTPAELPSVPTPAPPTTGVEPAPAPVAEAPASPAVVAAPPAKKPVDRSEVF